MVSALRTRYSEFTTSGLKFASFYYDGLSIVHNVPYSVCNFMDSKDTGKNANFEICITCFLFIYQKVRHPLVCANPNTCREQD